MNTIKSLILGTAAGFVAIAGAQAADLPVKAKAVQYVKICSLYGAGFYYIPGTETCIKIGGYVQFDVNLNANAYNSPFIQGGSGSGFSAFGSRDMDSFTTRQRSQFTLDTRTATEYGVVRSYWDVKFQFTSNTDNIAGGSLEVDYGFVQFAGFTFGKSVSAYSTPWNGSPANSNTSNFFGGIDNSTGVNNINYTWQFGNGVSAQIGLDEPKTTLAQGGYDRGLLINLSTATLGNFSNGGFAQSYGGNAAPDIVGNIRVDQAAFTAQLSAAAHNIHSTYYGANETSGHPSDTWGFAVQGSLQLKNLPTGAGDKLTVDVAYANGANRYIIGGTFGNQYSLTGGGGSFGYQNIAIGANADGVFGVGGSIEKTDAFGVRAGFVHNWNQYWESDVFGSYSKIDFNSNASTLYCTRFTALNGGGANGYSCNPDFAIWQIGTRLGWTPVRNLTFSAEVLYTALDQSMSGSANLTPGGFKPAGQYDFKDLGTLSGNLRVRRTF